MKSGTCKQTPPLRIQATNLVKGLVGAPDLPNLADQTRTKFQCLLARSPTRKRGLSSLDFANTLESLDFTQDLDSV